MEKFSLPLENMMIGADCPPDPVEGVQQALAWLNLQRAELGLLPLTGGQIGDEIILIQVFGGD